MLKKFTKKIKKNTFFISTFFWGFHIITIFSQQAKFDHEFLGVLLLDEKSMYSYRLEFNIDKDSIRGYSYTDLGGLNETKSYIYGIFNKRNNQISFEEKDVLYTKSDVGTDEFCFIKSTGKLVLKSRKNVFESSFEGIYNDGEICASGKIKVVGLKFLKKKINKTYKKIKKIKKIDSVVKEKLKPERVLNKFGKTNLSSDEIITVFMKNKKVRFQIWDYGKEDGDIVDIYINGKKSLPNVKLKKEKKSLYINLKKGLNKIKVTTVSAGKIKTNTAKIKIYDSSRFYELLSKIDEGKSAEINIVIK